MQLIIQNTEQNDSPVIDREQVVITRSEVVIVNNSRLVVVTDIAQRSLCCDYTRYFDRITHQLQCITAVQARCNAVC